MRMGAWVDVMLVLLASCHRGQPQPKTEAPPEAKATATTTVAPSAPETTPSPAEAVPHPKPGAFPACPGARAFSLDLTGLSQGRVSERFGPPAERETYRAGDRGGEFYVGLQNVYPSKIPGNRDFPIEEWTWTSGDCLLTVWFHRVDGVWTSLDDVYRNKDVAF